MNLEREHKYKLPFPIPIMTQRLLSLSYEMKKASHEIDTYYLVNEEIDGAPQSTAILHDMTKQTYCLHYNSGSLNVPTKINLTKKQAEEFTEMFKNMGGKSYLRIRFDEENDTCEVTYKRKTENPSERKEFDVKDISEEQAQALTLFFQQNYQEKCVVKKTREAWMRSDGSYEVAVDQVEYLGDFCEIENKKDTSILSLQLAGEELCLTEDDRVPDLKYADMMMALQNT
jgi:hypothetical protein